MPLASLGVTPVINRRSPSWLPPAVGAQPPYEYQSHHHALGDWLRPIHLNPARLRRSVYPTGLATERASVHASLDTWTECLFIYLFFFFYIFFLTTPQRQSPTQLHKARAISSSVLIFQLPVITQACKLSQRGLEGGFILDLLPENTSSQSRLTFDTCVSVARLQ